jgi:GT2 family glycosyltransferase
VESDPLISVIIVNFNGKDLLRDCIESVCSQSFLPLEIIVVDNASTDGSLENVRGAFPYVKIISLSENTGFAGGNLEGLKHANGKFILLLNNDVVLERGCIQSLSDAMEAQPDVGICGAKIIVYGKNVIDSAGDGFSTNLKGFKRGEGLSSNSYNRKENVFGVCAGAALYRRNMIDEIGFLDEDFFLIHEDTDINFRAQLSGWKVLFEPGAIVYHKVRSSIGHMSETAIYYTLRNSELLRIKNIPLMLFIRCLPEFILGTLSEIACFCFKHRKPGLYLKAKMDAIKLLPKMLRKRREIMRTKKVDNRYLYSIMTPVLNSKIFSDKLKNFFYR